MKRILVTGAAGFLGSYLTKELIAQGFHVIGIDNLSTGRMSNLQDIADARNFQFIECDVAANDILKMRELEVLDEIYHLASPASPKFYQQYPFDTISANTVGTRNVLEIARTGNAKLLYTSTSEVYGDPEISSQPENYRGNVNTWGPRACYDEAKRLGEVYCYEYYHRYGVQVRVARIFNTYSAGLQNDDGRVISNFVTQALTGNNMTIYGDGTQTRSFCYADDTIRGIRLCMKVEAAAGQIVNIGNPRSCTILELAIIIKKLSSSNSNISFLPLPMDDPKQRLPDITKAKEILGWEPEIDLEEGLHRTIEGYQKKLQ